MRPESSETPGTDQPLVLHQAADGIVTLTLNRPAAMNALTSSLVEELLLHVQRVAIDPEARVLVITGAGRAFCAGGDVKGMGSRDVRDSHQKREQLRRKHELPLALAQCPKIVIARINGPAMGAGLGLALACDFRIASRSARLGTAFARAAMSSDFGVSWLLPRTVGRARARELLLTGEPLDAEAALAIDLVSRVVDDTALDDTTLQWARRFACGPTLAYRFLKGNLAAAETLSFSEMLDLEAENQVAAVDSEDHREAARAFVEKRAPTFRGR